MWNMDHYAKTGLTVIAGCLLMLVGVQADFPPKAHAVSTRSLSGDKAGGAAVTDYGMVFFMSTYLDIVYCCGSDRKTICKN